MDLLMSLFVAALFVALTPGILLTLPTKGSKLTVAVVHGLVFAVVYHFTHKAVFNYLYEGFAPVPRAKPRPMVKPVPKPMVRPKPGPRPMPRR
jgi:hypothetical protein